MAGSVYAPALKLIYLGGTLAVAAMAEPGAALGKLAFHPISVRTPPANYKTAVMSRSHADETTRQFAKHQGVVDTIADGSSLKFCKLAEGAADLYARYAPTMEWSTAAGHAVLNAAGDKVLMIRLFVTPRQLCGCAS